MTKALLIGAGVVLMVLGAGAWYWTRTHRRLDEAERQVEALRLALHGQIVTAQDTKRELAKSVDELLAQNQELKRAYDEARALAPGSKPVASGSLRTGKVRVDAPARVPPVAPGPPPGESVAPALPADTGHPGITTGPPDSSLGKPGFTPGACVLAQDDAISFLIEELALETSQGNRLVVGTAEAWREDPLPRALLGRGRFQAALSETSTLVPAPPRRWGVLALGACYREGCGPGVGVLAPPFSVPFLGQVEGQAQALALPGGWVGVAGLGLRF
jgi:hypothetical protein